VRALFVTLASLTLTLCVLVPSRAWGQAPDDRSNLAREHFERGVQFAQSEQWGEAIRELQAAREIRATAAVHYNLAMAYRAVGRRRDAIASFEAYLRELGTHVEPQRWSQIQEMIASLRAGLARLDVQVVPSIGSIMIDGLAMAPGQNSFQLDPGSHVVVMEANGYRPATRVVNLAPGASSSVAVWLPEMNAAAHLQIESSVREATIRIDGQAISNGRADEYVRPGVHTVEVRAPGYATFRRQMMVLPSSSAHVQAVLADQRSVFVRPLFWVGTVLAAGALVAGGIVLDRVITAEQPFEGRLGHVTGAVVARP
jgi:hypothetical protein